MNFDELVIICLICIVAKYRENAPFAVQRTQDIC
jgi:hypothetical protein